MIAKSQVSVTLPAFNGARWVVGALVSLFDQTFRDIEVIAVNDASTNSSGQMLDRLARDEPRLKLIRATMYSLN
jgi:glycosyltransferase involved in cell wall biosynthesis